MVLKLTDSLIQAWEETLQETICQPIISVLRHSWEFVEVRGGHIHY